ncbi:hypothetical protein DL768_006343 [Monosporascus sp. mg162]|nr:hypothetical protein DL768_006343 [Monosporascus sp. mg162]
MNSRSTNPSNPAPRDLQASYLEGFNYREDTEAFWWSKEEPYWTAVTDFDHQELKNQLRNGQGYHDRLDIVILKGRSDKGSTTISTTKTKFESLIKKFKIHTSCLSGIQHKNGQCLHSLHGFSQIGGLESPTSLSAVVQTPFWRLSPLDQRPTDISYFLAIQISARTNSVACIFIVPDAARVPDTGRVSNIDFVTEFQRRIELCLDLLQRCPLSLLHVLCEELDYQNEESGRKLVHRNYDLENDIANICIAAQQSDNQNLDVRYAAHSKAIHDFNLLHLGLDDLVSTTEFEQNSLNFAISVIDEYQTMRAKLRQPNPSAEQLEICRRLAQRLRAASQSRKARCSRIVHQAKAYVGLIEAHNFKENSLLDLQISVASIEQNLSLKTISILTLVFLPLGLVTTIFGSNAFDAEHGILLPAVKQGRTVAG